MTRPIVGTVLAAVLCRGSARAQTADSQPAFEVASVKPNAEGRGREQVQSSPTSLTIRNASLTFYIHWAYDVRFDQITRPAWLNTERYDIVAKTAGPSTESQLRLMLQSLLAERFQLALHRETKPLSVYEMVAAKSGPKLTESKSGDTGGTSTNRASYELRHTSLPEFAVRLAELGAVDLPVVDRTGIQGSFDISLKFPDGWRPSPQPDPNGVSIFTILEEQLGLKLELRKSATEILVVDHAEKVPVGN